MLRDARSYGRRVSGRPGNRGPTGTTNSRASESRMMVNNLSTNSAPSSRLLVVKVCRRHTLDQKNGDNPPKAGCSTPSVAIFAVLTLFNSL